MSDAQCDRFDRDFLSGMMAGDPPDDHERDCSPCQTARGRYERLSVALTKLPAIAAPAGWEARVLAALPDEQALARARWPLWVGGLAAAAVAVLVLSKVLRPAPAPLAVRQEVRAASAGRRADSASVGDSIRVSATGGAGAVRELRVYRDNKELVARCPGDARCEMNDQATNLTVTMGAAGSYRSLVIVGSQKAPEPTGSLDGDARASTAAGSIVEMSLAVDAE